MYIPCFRKPDTISVVAICPNQGQVGNYYDDYGNYQYSYANFTISTIPPILQNVSDYLNSENGRGKLAFKFSGNSIVTRTLAEIQSL